MALQFFYKFIRKFEPAQSEPTNVVVWEPWSPSPIIIASVSATHTCTYICRSRVSHYGSRGLQPDRFCGIFGKFGKKRRDSEGPVGLPAVFSEIGSGCPGEIQDGLPGLPQKNPRSASRNSGQEVSKYRSMLPTLKQIVGKHRYLSSVRCSRCGLQLGSLV